jgi:hypothetical protein
MNISSAVHLNADDINPALKFYPSPQISDPDILYWNMSLEH